MTARRTVAITGAAGGIGRALARQFAQAGYSVAAIVRDGAAIGELAALDPAIEGYQGDVADPASIGAALEAAARAQGAIDVLIANAAIHPRGWFLDQGPEVLEQVLRVNVAGVANTIRPVLPAMLARNHGRIVVMGSLADMNPRPPSLAYAVSKGALHTLVRGIALEIDRTRYPDVLVNEFSPGATRTAMSDHGNDPEAIFAMLRPLVECGADGPHGAFFQEGRRIRVGESWKGALKRLVLRR
jgi:NAD(P)-dependent dehydrogenase (short-subunit alcohol dehydrogenase family)